VRLKAKSGAVTIAQPSPTDAQGAAVAHVQCAEPGVALLSAYLDDGISLNLLADVGPLFCLAQGSATNAGGPMPVVGF